MLSCLHDAASRSVLLRCRVLCVSQGAATLLQQYQDQIHASRVSIAAHLAAAIHIVPHQLPQPFITSAAYSTLCSSAELISQLAEEAHTADQQHAYSSTVPGWQPALMALQAASHQGADLLQAACYQRNVSTAAARVDLAEGSEPGGRSVEELWQQWQEKVEAVVKSMLLWAQNIRCSDDEPVPDAGMTRTMLSPVFTLRLDNLLLSW